MSCLTPAVGPAIGPMLAPIVTAGFVATLFTKNIFYPFAFFAVIWHMITFTAFYIDGSVDVMLEVITWPLAVFVLGQIAAAVLSQIGNFPRLFNYDNVLRTYLDSRAGIYDRRNTVWEGLVFGLSIVAIYLGVLFVADAYSDGCAFVTEVAGDTIGWILIIVGILGIVLLALVTFFSVHAHNIERLRFWKYVIAGVFLIVFSALLHILLYVFVPSIGVWYGLIGLIPIIIGWVVMYWYIRDVHFYSDLDSAAAFKALGDSDDAAVQMALLDRIDGFEKIEYLIAFVVAAGLYNFFAVLLVWLVAHFVVPVFWSFVALLILTAVFIIVVILLGYLTAVFGWRTGPGAAYKQL